MKEILKQYTAYNVWANQKILEVIQGITNDELHKTIKSSFPTINKTLLHIWDAESIWWQRLKLQEHITRPSDKESQSTDEITSGISKVDLQWRDWIYNATDAAIDHVFAYQDSKKEQFKQPVYQVILHLFNHTTYHRGQLVTMFNQLSIDKIPATDFIVWSRLKK